MQIKKHTKNITSYLSVLQMTSPKIILSKANMVCFASGQNHRKIHVTR